MAEINVIGYCRIQINTTTNKNSTERTLSFPNGLFHGKETTLRISDDSQWVSVWDVIKMVGEQKDPYKIWERIDKTEVRNFCTNLKFKGSGQRETPCVNAKGLVLLLMQIPGEKAKQFRLAGADILVRYLGGDTTLIGEIEAINDTHNSNPENQASFFRNSETVQNNINSVYFSRDQLNNSKKLLARSGGETDLMYAILFVYNGILYMKFGIVYIRLFDTRYMEHVTTLGNGDINGICIYLAIKCKDVAKIESDFKKTTFYKMNKTDITINGTNYTEIIELTDNITADTIKEEIIKVAGDRIIDPPPEYNEITNGNLEIEQEKTKQKEYDMEVEKARELTKQKQLDFEMKKLEFEMLKQQSSSITTIDTVVSSVENIIVPDDTLVPTTIVSSVVTPPPVVSDWFSENIIYKKGNILRLSEINTKRYNTVLGPRSSTKEKEKVQVFLKERYRNENWMYQSTSYKGKNYRGWINFGLK
jgi:hypothetical protein